MPKSEARKRAEEAAKSVDLTDFVSAQGWMGPYPGIDGADLWARYGRSPSGRWALSGVMLLGDAITSAQLRKVPVAALENSWNLSNAQASAKRDEISDLPPLKRTPDMTPEAFSRLVAEHYRRWADLVPHAVPAMAADCGASRATVHSWVREARLRGFLPPGRERKTQ